MELKFTIDTEDLGYFDENGDMRGKYLEDLITEELSRTIMKGLSTKLVSDQFKAFSVAAQDKVMAEIKLKLENFLSEEIALTDKWGKATFVGSFEDLIKSRFDEVLLKPVNSDGKPLRGCTADGNTWIEWKLSHILEGRLKTEINSAKKEIDREIDKKVKSALQEMKDGAIKTQVDSVFSAILKQVKE